MNIKQINVWFLFFALASFHHNAFSQDHNESCPIIRNIGSEKICLPVLNDMIECIMETNVRDFIDSISMKGNKHIAVYIEKNKKHILDNLEDEGLDNYLLIYTTDELEDKNINNDFILTLDSIITSNYKSFIDENWHLVKEMMYERVANIKFDQPVLIEHYLIENNVPCLITLSRATKNNQVKLFLTATVVRELNRKFIAYAWYMNYDDESTLKKLKSQMNYFSLIMSQLNLSRNPQMRNTNTNEKHILAQAMEFFNTAIDLSGKGKYSDAVDLYTKAIELYPPNEYIKISIAYFNRGLNKRYLNDLSGAISDYSAAINVRPNYYKAYYNRGFAKNKNEDFTGAIDDFSIVINSGIIDNDLFAISYGNRGLAKLAIGINPCTDLEKAFELGNSSFLKTYLDNCK